MKLVKLDNFKLTISPEAFGIKAFRDLFDRDASLDKDMAMLELTYIYFMCDPRSDYTFIVDKEERANIIKAQQGFDAEWEPDELVEHAMEIYTFMSQTSSSLLIESAKIGIDKVRKLILDVDLMEKDDKGKPAYGLNIFVSSLKQLSGVAKDLAEAEKVIAKELEASTGRMRAQREKTVTEDGYEEIVKNLKNGKDKGSTETID